MDLKRILVPVDGSENSKRAFNFARRIARQTGSQLIVLNVIDGRAYDRAPSEAMEGAKQLIHTHVSEAKKNGIMARGEAIRPGASIVRRIVEYAKQKRVDLIVMGTRGLGGFRKLLLGSVSSGVVSHAHCAVTVVR
ncbi:MAG TPA: universal stress protein [Candidatus Bathyarchaeia archaeon]|nr:universal stress protein [Candidatus Bathyarchaeia archaeon]